WATSARPAGRAWVWSLPRLWGGGKKSPPAAVAVALRLLPWGLAGPRLHAAGVGPVAGPRLLTARAGALGLRPLVGAGGLLGQGKGAHLLGQGLADFAQDVRDLGEGGPPGRALGPVELVHQVLGEALDVGAPFFYLGGALLGSRHPWLLSELGSTTRTDFPQPGYNHVPPAANRVGRPRWVMPG